MDSNGSLKWLLECPQSKLVVSAGDDQHVVWERSGNQGNEWTEGFLNVAFGSEHLIAFKVNSTSLHLDVYNCSKRLASGGKLGIRHQPISGLLRYNPIHSSFPIFPHFLPNPGRILPALTFNGCDPLYVNAGRFLQWFGRKLRNIGKLD